jgi:exo-beta-1,3-glucanase (GH17 family)
MKRSSSASSFSSMREKLEKTSKVLQNLGVSNTSTSNNSSEEMTKELQLLRSKVAQLEREK